MYIYSVTIIIDKTAELDWLDFMQQKHIEDVLKTGYFTKATMRRALNKTDDNTTTYNIEYLTGTIEQYDAYVQQAAPLLQKEVAERFTGKFTAQRNFFEVVSEY